MADGIKAAAVLLAAGLIGPEAGEAGAQADRKPKPRAAAANGPLARVPGGLGAHVARLQALGDNAWLTLGAPQADPKWGKAPGRSYTSKMAYAPDLRVAFLYGEGAHGYVKENGHYMNDFWAYDINGHRWICIDPGLDTKNFQVKVNQDGFEVDKDGNVLPVAQLVHGYEQTTYDPDLRKFIFVPSPSGYWRVKGLAEARPHVGKDVWNWTNKNASPWMYDVPSGKWELRKVQGEERARGAADAAFYIRSLRKTLHWHRDSLAIYDYAANTWKLAAPQGKVTSVYDLVACHDTLRDRVYFFGDRLSIYDVRTNAWIESNSEGPPVKGGKVRLASWTGHMTYDSVNDVVVLIAHFPDFGPVRGLHIYDPKTDTWTKAPQPFPGDKWNAGVASNAFYDPELNLHYYHLAGDSRDDGTIWVYRYKNRKGRK